MSNTEEPANCPLALYRQFSQWVGLSEMANLLCALGEFMDAFELVFGGDWEYSKFAIGCPHECAGTNYNFGPGGTFLAPGVEDESNNWFNRGYLLHSYRKLRKELGLLDGKFQKEGDGEI